MSRRAGWVLALGLVAAAAASSLGAMPCADLTSLALPDTTITSAELVPASSASPAFCGVQGVVTPAVRFEVHMPATGWNGKLQGVGNGAFAGDLGIGPAAVRQGYAVAATDTGHAGSPLDASWALGHPELVVDFGHRGVHVMTVAAKAVVEAFYGTPPARSYFLGCSTGGKQGLTEAQRYPDDYDGIVVGAPANYFTHLVMGSNWIAQALHENPASMIPTAQLPLVAAAVLARCDARDGIVDGVLDDPRRCRFHPGKLRCKGAAAPTCLTDAQIAGLKKVYAGPRLVNGTRVFPGHPPGGEVGANGWGTWIAGTGPTLGLLIQDSFFRYMVFENPGFDWRAVDVDRDMPVVDAKLAAVLNATDPDLSAFQAHGGKIVMFHGWSDAAISPLNSIDYWESVAAAARSGGGPHVDDYLRLFMVPGMQHCSGGPGPNTFDALGPLERWVEQGIAPDAIIATHTTAGTVDRTRPLCPYPLVARWDGVGSTDDAASFSCARRRRRVPRG